MELPIAALFGVGKLMSENADWFLQADKAEAQEKGTLEQVLALKLPSDLAARLQTYSRKLGQTPAEAIVSLLRSALDPNTSGTSNDSEPSAPEHSISTEQELQQLRFRLDQLEGLIPRLEFLEGKCMAF